MQGDNCQHGGLHGGSQSPTSISKVTSQKDDGIVDLSTYESELVEFHAEDNNLVDHADGDEYDDDDIDEVQKLTFLTFCAS